jgi:hypothetical protein
MKGIGVRILETEGDLAAGAARLVALEPRFGPVVAAGPLPLRRRADGFAALLSAIVAQQVSTASAAAIWGRVAAAGLDREEAWDAVEDATLIACGLSRPKQRYGRALAAAGIDWAALRDADTEEVVETLMACRGWGAGRRRSTRNSRSAMPMSSPRATLRCRKRAAAVRSAGPAGRAGIARNGGGLGAGARGCRPGALGLLPLGHRPGGRLVSRVLEYGRKAPACGDCAKRLVIFLHGYGADGNDLLGLADPLAPHMPDTVFVAPNAPERSAMNPMGYQWFPIPWIDGSSEEQSQAGMVRAVEDLNAFLDTVMAEEGVGRRRRRFSWASARAR